MVYEDFGSYRPLDGSGFEPAIVRRVGVAFVAAAGLAVTTAVVASFTDPAGATQEETSATSSSLLSAASDGLRHGEICASASAPEREEGERGSVGAGGPEAFR